MNGPRLLGLDLAWSDRNPSGAAALDPAGTLLDVRADLRSDDEILAWVRHWLGTSGAIGIDMPTIVPNATGMRPCEHDLSRAFRAAHAGAYPANRSIAWFADGGRAARILAALRADGVVEDPQLGSRDARNVALEVFPHAAHVRLFGLDRIFWYKQRKGRPHRAEWARYRAALDSLAAADPPLVLDAERVPVQAPLRGYKSWDDRLDAITCAYVAAFAHRWGAAGLDVFGDLQHGYIVVPAPARVWQPSGPGTSVPWTLQTSRS